MNLIREAAKVINLTGPVVPDGWNIGNLPNNGIILSCDGFSVKFNVEQLNTLFDIAEDGKAGEIKDSTGRLIYVEPNEKTIIITRQGDKNYPFGVVIDAKTLKKIGIEEHNEPEENAASTDNDDNMDEGIKLVYRRVGTKIKRGFRVTSGFRKGRVVATAAGAYKPRAKASTRSKMRIGRYKKRVIRILKSKKTRKKSASRRLVRLNKHK